MTQHGRLMRGVVFLWEAAETSQRRCVCAWFGRTDRTYTWEVEKWSQTGEQPAGLFREWESALAEITCPLRGPRWKRPPQASGVLSSALNWTSFSRYQFPPLGTEFEQVEDLQGTFLLPSRHPYSSERGPCIMWLFEDWPHGGDVISFEQLPYLNCYSRKKSAFLGP